MSNLLISNNVLYAFSKLENYFEDSAFVDGDLDIKVVARHLVFGVQQNDRYEKGVMCYIELRNENVSFTFRDVSYAIANDPDFGVLGLNKNAPTRAKNDLIVGRFIEFCQDHKDVLQQWPPQWFPAASKMSVAALVKVIPFSAETVRLANEKAWENICNSSK